MLWSPGDHTCASFLLCSRAKCPSRVSLTVCDTLAFLLFLFSFFFTLMCHLVSNYLTCPERKQITILSDGLSAV